MDIRCPECKTLYEFDDSRLESGSATLKCRKCKHLFRLGEGSKPSREDEQRWMVRDAEKGDILYLNGFDTLHRWIVERKVDRSWQISRTGDKWTTLGTIGEFRPIFQVVENVSSIEGEEAVDGASSSRSQEGESGSGSRAKRETLDQFQGEASSSGAAASASQSASTRAAGADRSGARAAQSGEIGDSQQVARSERPSPGHQPAQSSERTSSPHQVPSQASVEGTASQSGSVPVQGDEPEEPTRSRQPSPEPTSAQKGRAAGARNRVGSPRESQKSEPVRGNDSDRSGVQLDSGMFGSEEEGPAPGASDEWAFGDEDVPFDDTTQVSEEEFEGVQGGGRRWSVVLVVALLLAVGGGAYLWTYEREQVRTFFGMNDSRETVNLSGEESGEGEAGEAGPVRRASAVLTEAVSRAAESAESEAGEQFTAVVAEASSPLLEAIERAAEEAEQEAEEEEEGGSISSLIARGNEALERGDYQKAREVYHEIIDQEASNSEALTGLGWALLNLGNPDSARAQFERALHFNSSYGDAYIGLGTAYRELGEDEKALEAYETYIEKLPDGSQVSIAEHQRNQLRERLGVE